MCNFILPSEKKLPGDQRHHGVHIITGEKLYSKWKKKYENLDRKEIKRGNENR